jgi:tRNA A-37 threonylcarbamoyl transferase component Bud32
MFDIPSRELVRQIDANLKFVNSFTPASTQVFLVNRTDGYYVLKLADKRKHPLEPHYRKQSRLKHLSQEERILRELAAVEGITHLIRKYDSPTHVALLKEFCEGRPTYKSTSLTDYRALKQKIMEIHSHGIAGLDIRHSNFIKDPYQDAQSPVMIDFGTGIFMKDVTLKEFAKCEEEDLAALAFMFFRRV